VEEERENNVDLNDTSILGLTNNLNTSIDESNNPVMNKFLQWRKNSLEF
jgi:hypothetical protein